MKKSLAVALITCAALSACKGQNKNDGSNSASKLKTETNRVGGDCEAGYCDLIYTGMPKEINSVDTSAGWHEKGQKLLVTGIVFQIDGKTPASNVIVYFHHTDNYGYYSPGNDKPENQTRHGHIRGWIKTNENGKYVRKCHNFLYQLAQNSKSGTTFSKQYHFVWEN